MLLTRYPQCLIDIKILALCPENCVFAGVASETRSSSSVSMAFAKVSLNLLLHASSPRDSGGKWTIYSTVFPIPALRSPLDVAGPGKRERFFSSSSSYVFVDARGN